MNPIRITVKLKGSIQVSAKVKKAITVTAILANTVVGAAPPPFVDVKIFESDGITLVAEKGSGETFNISKHDILLPDGTVHQSDEFNVDFNLPITYNFPQPGGSVIIRRTGDELDIWGTIFASGVIPSVGERVLFDPDDFLKILTENAFGNFDRFTNDVGTTTSYTGGEGETARYTIDHATGLAWLTQNQRDISGGIGDANWDDNIDNALVWVQGPYDDFFLPSFHQLSTIMKRGTGQTLDYAPFSVTVNIQYWTSTTAISPTTEAFVINRLGIVNDNAKTTVSSRNALYCRKHY